MAESETLSACPFCGGAAELDSTRYGRPVFNWITCSNALLIAAAPELLTALSELVDAIWNGDLEQMGAEHFTDPARALIAKVKGQL